MWEVRKTGGLSQTQLADKLGLTRSQINHYESGRQMPSPHTIVAIADLYECDPGWLLTGRDQYVPPDPKPGFNNTQLKLLAKALTRVLSLIDEYLEKTDGPGT